MTLTIPGIVRLETDPHGLERLVITNGLGEAEVFLLGAQVTHFRPREKEPFLWLSPLSSFEKGKAIRGGVPICWPWFGPHPMRPELPAHGVARTRLWQGLDTAQLADGRTRIRLSLSDDDETRALWPHPFHLTMSVTVGAALELELTTTNTGDEPFSYADALHTYLRVEDVRRCRVHGLDDAPFVHSTKRHRGVQRGALTFEGEVNNIYVPNRGTVGVFDPLMNRAIDVAKSGSLATVVWNPGEEGGSAMKDVRSRWTEFVCVEAANCADAQIQLTPGASHMTAQTIRAADEESPSV